MIRNRRRSGKSLLTHWRTSRISGVRWSLIAIILLALAAGGFAGAGRAEPAHGIAMHGTPALAPGFANLPYADPAAVKGGRVVFGETGGFDSLNPYLLKGRAPWGVRAHTIESLMARSYDEPFTLYGLLAESVETPEDRSWVEFTLRRQARFADGSPVTVADVIWSRSQTTRLGPKG